MLAGLDTMCTLVKLEIVHGVQEVADFIMFPVINEACRVVEEVCPHRRLRLAVLSVHGLRAHSAPFVFLSRDTESISAMPPLRTLQQLLIASRLHID